MREKLNISGLLPILFISISIFFWDIQINLEVLNFNIGSRFLYLTNLLIIIFFFKKYYYEKKLLSKSYIIFSLILSILIYFHSAINAYKYFSFDILLIVGVIFSSLIIVKIFSKSFLEHKLYLLKIIISASILFYIFSLFGFIFFDPELSEFKSSDLLIYFLSPCNTGFYNNFDFFYSESSHFAMISISIYMTSFYYLVESNFKDKFLLILFLCFMFILFNNMSLTLIMGIFACQISILIVALKKKYLKYVTLSTLLTLIFLSILFNTPTCKYKLNNAIWLVSQPVKFTINKLITKDVTNIKKDKNIEKDVRTKKIKTQFGELELTLGRTTDLSSAVLIHNLKVAGHSILDKFFGWGINNYFSAFKYYSIQKNMVLHHEYAINVNKEDGSINFPKLIVEFGFVSFILGFIYIYFLFSKKIDLSEKVFLFPLVFTQLFLRGAGYFNGGFLIATILICILIFNKNDKSN